MKKRIYSLLFLPVLTSALLTGCGDGEPRPESPAERNQLVIRLFSSMEKQDAASAAAQAEKLRVLDPGNAYFRWIAEQQACNQAVIQARQQMEQGNFKEADAILGKAVRQFPLHRALLQERQKLQQLQELDQAIRTYRAAAALPDRDMSLRRVETLAGPWKNPELNAAVTAQRKKIQAKLSAASHQKPAAPVQSSAKRP